MNTIIYVPFPDVADRWLVEYFWGDEDVNVHEIRMQLYCERFLE